MELGAVDFGSLVTGDASSTRSARVRSDPAPTTAPKPATRGGTKKMIPAGFPGRGGAPALLRPMVEFWERRKIFYGLSAPTVARRSRRRYLGVSAPPAKIDP
jgi:hypothetical protein